MFAYSSRVWWEEMGGWVRLQLVLEKSVLVAPSEKVLVVAARAAAQMVGHGAGAAPSSHQHTNTLFFAKNSNLIN